MFPFIHGPKNVDDCAILDMSTCLKINSFPPQLFKFVETFENSTILNPFGLEGLAK